MRFHSLEKLVNLTPGYRRQFKVDSLLLLLIQHQDQRFLIEANCPHHGYGLENGRVSDNVIQCPLHHLRFSLLNGELLSRGEQSCRALNIYELVYQGNEVGFMVDE